MSEILLPGNIINESTGLRVVKTPLGKFTEIIAVADVTTTLQTVLDLKVRSGQADRPDTVVGTIPVGAQICFVGIRVPSGLIGTNGDGIKLAVAVSSNGTQTFNADASTSYVRSTVAASTTYAAEAKTFTISPLLQAAGATQSAALSGAVTYKIYVDNGTTGAGTGIRVASGTAQILARIIYWQGLDMPVLEGVNARPARA